MRFGDMITCVCRPIKEHLKLPEINQDYVRKSTATLSNIYYTVETHNSTPEMYRMVFEAVFTWSKRDYVKLVQISIAINNFSNLIGIIINN